MRVGVAHSPEDEKRLHKTSLRELNAKDLELYATDALFVWGNVDDFRHFLPRIFELAVTYGQEFVDQPIVLQQAVPRRMAVLAGERNKQIGDC